MADIRSSEGKNIHFRLNGAFHIFNLRSLPTLFCLMTSIFNCYYTVISTVPHYSKLCTNDDAPVLIVLNDFISIVPHYTSCTTEQLFCTVLYKNM